MIEGALSFPCAVLLDAVRRVVVSPWFGKLSAGGYRRVLMQANSLVVVGAILYALAPSFEALILAQITLGVGSGTLGVTRAYIADKSTPDQRTYYLAYMT